MCEDLFSHVTFVSRVRLLEDKRGNNRDLVEMVMYKHTSWDFNCMELLYGTNSMLLIQRDKVFSKQEWEIEINLVNEKESLFSYVT